jgi:hypothetical protein
MFTKRTNWNTRPNAIAKKVAEIRASGASVLDLTETNPTRCGFTFYRQDLLQSLTQDEALVYDPDPRGLVQTREAIAAYYTRGGHTIDPEHLFVTAGTSEAYGHLFRLLLEPGECILVPTPSYPLLEFLADIHDVRLKPYPLHYDDRWWPDLDALRDAIDDACRAIVAIHPNNPTGSYLDSRELEELGAIAAASDLALIVDEVFFDYPMDDDAKARSVANGEALTFTLNGISKTLGLPQMKLSWMVASGPDELVEAACDRLEVIADTALSVSTPIQLAACDWLSRASHFSAEILERVRSNYACLSTCAGLDALSVEGGWSAILRIPRTCPEEQFVLDLLEQDHILVDPGSFYGFASEGYVVVSLLPEPGVFQDGIRRLAARHQV